MAPRSSRSSQAATVEAGRHGERLVLGADLVRPEAAETPLGSVAWFSARGAGKRQNEDGVLVFPLGTEHVVLAVVDGMGGMPNGDRAAALALEALATRLARRPADQPPCDAVIAGFERAQRSVLRRVPGAGATLVAAVVGPNSVQLVHSGDAEGLVHGQRGRIKLRTIAHSPTGHLLATGALDEDAALTHEERHIVTNAIGISPLVVEVGAEHPLAARDTVLVASDGLFDNLRVAEIAALAGHGPVEVALERLAAAARARMDGAEEGMRIGKPDDLTVALMRAPRVR